MLEETWFMKGTLLGVKLFCHVGWQIFKQKRNQIASFLGSPARSEVSSSLTDIAGVAPEGE